MSSRLLLIVLLSALSLTVNAFSKYKAEIPNGDKVPNPCNRSTSWAGVGHQSVDGGGVRNPFGLDFAANNHTWNRTMCQKDSDGDGMTNGQELGDPNCIWMKGSTPTFSTNLSHPGVCEPIGSTLCSAKNSWLMNCMPKKFNCPTINSTGARNYTLRIPPTPIPTKETTYMCYRFNLPNDSVSDIIAIEPVIDNARVLHHMLLFACTDEPKNDPKDRPFDCGMAGSSTCLSLIGIWGVGVTGQCLHNQVGFRIGATGFQYAVLQLHWNNPDLITNMTDSSGMKIYHTTQLRPNRGQVAMVGQTYLEIPPGKTGVTFTGNCSSSCTKHLTHPIFVTASLLHMHNLGKSGDIRISRDGKLVKLLDNVTDYDYASPTMTELETPIEFQPGDEIQVKCVFDSTKRNTTTIFGAATSDEMCYGFITYYPLVPDIGYCGQWKTINICSDKHDTEFGSCDMATVMKLISLLPTVCAESCTSTPCAVIMDGIQATGCHNFPDVKEFVYAFMSTYGKIFARCATERPPKNPNTPCDALMASSSPDRGASSGFPAVFALMVMIAFHLAPSTISY